MLSFYFVPFACGLTYWLAFFPGIMSFDSVYQWEQLSTLQINNWHPAIHTILLWLLTRIWNSPAIISLFQVIIASLVIGYGLNSIRNASKLPGYLFIVIAILISANPMVGIMDVTLWKDVLYSFLVLLVSIFLFNLIVSDGEWILKPKNFILMGFSLAGIWLIRFNGYPVVLGCMVITVIIYKKNFKYFAFASLITLAIIFMINGPVYTLFKVDKTQKMTYGIAFIHPVVPYVNSKTDFLSLSEIEKEYLNQIYPINRPWPYSCYDATVFYYNNTNLSPVIKAPLMMVKIFTHLVIHDPKIALNHFICLSSFVWQPSQPHNVYLETVLLDNYDLNQTPSWLVYKDEVTQNSLLPEVRGLINRVIRAEWRRDNSMFLWRPAAYMYLFFISLGFFVVRKRRMKWLLLSMPVIAQTVVIMFTTQLQALRYQYSIYLISMLFSIPLIIWGIKKTDSIDPERILTESSEQ